MSNELDPTIDAYIKRILPQAKKELKYVEDEDWGIIVNVKARENVYKIQHLLVDRNVKYAIKLYNTAGEDLSKKRVKVALDTLLKFFTIYAERYKKMIEKFDWTSFNLDDDKEAKKATAEVEFQSAVLKNVNDLEEHLRSINFGGESDELHMEFHGNAHIPFMMNETMEEMYPDIKKHLAKKYKKK